jgi:sugar phosphate isomerase/epimerase
MSCVLKSTGVSADLSRHCARSLAKRIVNNSVRLIGDSHMISCRSVAQLRDLDVRLTSVRASRVHTEGLRRGTAYSSADHANLIPGDTAMNRRQMMKAFPALAAAATAVADAMPAEAQAVTQQTPKAPPAYKGRLRPGVIALSYRPQLEAKEMTYEDIVRVIADLGLEGMEMTGYWLPPMLSFPPGTPSTQISEMVRKTPANPTPQWLASLRNTAFKNGIDIYGVGSPVKMAQPTPELRQKEIAFGKKWIDIADAVGASSVRVFGGGIAQGATETQAVAWAVEVYKPILDYAAAKGVVLGLEDDDDLTRTSAQLLTIVKQVNHPAARIALDCGNFRKDGYKECEICAPYASSTHVKPQMSTPDGQREPADWAKLFGILANAGYRGYVSLELSTPDNPVPKYAAELIRCARMYSGA